MSAVVKWGLITGLVYVVYSLVMNLLGLQDPADPNFVMSMLFGTVIFAVTFFTVYLGVKEFRNEENGGSLTLGEGFIKGFQIALIAAVISGIFSIIYFYFIDPDMISRFRESTEQQWEENNMSDEQIETASKVMGFMMNPWIMTAMSVVMVIFWGVIKGLIVGAILKTPPKTPIVEVPLT